MLKKYLLVLFLLSLNHVVIYGASADQGQSITNQAPLTAIERRNLFNIVARNPVAPLNFKDEAAGASLLVTLGTKLLDRDHLLRNALQGYLLQENADPLFTIYVGQGADVYSASLDQTQKEDKQKYVLDLRTLLPIQAMPTQPQSTIFAKTLSPQGPPTVYGHRLSPMQQPSLGRTGQQAGIPLTLTPPLLPFHFQQQSTALQIEAARMAERERQIQAAEIAERERQIQAARIAAQERQIAELAEIVNQLKMQMQGSSEAQQQAASSERATYKPVEQSMSPEQLKTLIQEGISDEDFIAMGVTSEDILQAKQELAQETLRQLTIDQNKQEQESISLQEEQDRALALELQQQEEEAVRRQQVQSTTQQTVERDKKSADDQLENQQTESVKHSNAARPSKKEMQRAARARKKAELEAKVKERLINLSEEDYQDFIEQSKQNSSHRRSADNADEIKNAALKIYRERSDNNRQLIRAIELARIEKAEKEEAEREKIKKAQKKAQEDQAAREASERAAKQKLEEAQLAQQLAQKEQAKPQQQGPSRNRKQKGKGDQLSADSAALQAEKDRREREYLDQQAAALQEKGKAVSLEDQIKKEIGLDLYETITQKKELTKKAIDELLRMLRTEAKKNENFPIRLWAARHLIKNPYSTVFNNAKYASKKIEAIKEAIEFVFGAVDYEGIKAAIDYYLTQPSLAENDRSSVRSLMLRAKEECLLPDDRQEKAKRIKEIETLEAKIEKKLNPKDSTSILKSLKDQQQPKTQAEIVMDQFTHGLTDWAASVLLDPIKGYQFLTEGQNTSGLIQQLDWWRVSLGAMISTHAQSAEPEKRLYLMELTSVYARLLKAVTLSVAGKPLDSKTRDSLDRIVTFLSDNARHLEQSNSNLKEEINREKKSEIEEKLAIINDLINESNELLKTNPDFLGIC